MSCVILYKVIKGYSGEQKSKLRFVSDDDGDIYDFPARLDAIKYCEHNELFQSGQAEFRIVELRDL